MKYTKGPWVIDTETDGKLHKVSIRGEGDIGQMLQICEINNYVDSKTGGANSSLIASAPDMLEALEQLLDVLGILRQSGVNVLAIPKAVEARSLAHKAIAKAKGSDLR